MTIEIYSTDTDEGTISVIRKDASGHTHVAQIPVGNAPRGAVKFTKDGRGYVSNCGGDTISEIDAFSHREIGRIKVGAAPRGIGIVPGDRYALVSNSGNNSVSVVDLAARREVWQFAVGRDPRHMAVHGDGQRAYVAVWGSHYVAKVDLTELAASSPDVSKLRETAQIHMEPRSHPYSVAIHPDGNRLFVANTQSTQLAVADLSVDDVVAKVDLGSKGARAIAFSPDGAIAFVSIENVSEIACIDTTTLAVVSRLPTGPGPRGLSLDPKDLTLYVAAFERGTIGGGAGLKTWTPDALTVISLHSFLPSLQASLKAGNQSAQSPAPTVDFAGVGKGACSVSVIDLDRVRASRRATLP